MCSLPTFCWFSFHKSWNCVQVTRSSFTFIFCYKTLFQSLTDTKRSQTFKLNIIIKIVHQTHKHNKTRNVTAKHVSNRNSTSNNTNVSTLIIPNINTATRTTTVFKIVIMNEFPQWHRFWPYFLALTILIQYIFVLLKLFYFVESFSNSFIHSFIMQITQKSIILSIPEFTKFFVSLIRKTSELNTVSTFVFLFLNALY